MINIYTKTAKEIEKENNEYRYGAALVKGTPRKACPTYLMRSNGERVDTRDLTEGQIMRLIENDVKDYQSPNGSYKKGNKKDLDTFQLLKVIEKTWRPSYDALYQLCKMDYKYGHIMMDILGVADTRNFRHDAHAIAKFQKECNNDFSDVTIPEMLGIMQQMSYNEQIKEQYQHRSQSR